MACISGRSSAVIVSIFSLHDEIMNRDTYRPQGVCLIRLNDIIRIVLGVTQTLLMIGFMFSMPIDMPLPRPGGPSTWR